MVSHVLRGLCVCAMLQQLMWVIATAWQTQGPSYQYSLTAALVANYRRTGSLVDVETQTRCHCELALVSGNFLFFINFFCLF